MKASACVFTIGLLTALPAYAWQASPNVVPGAAPVQQTVTPAEVPAAKPCSAAAIRAAAARKVAPGLIGCNLAVVAPPLLQFFHLVPKTTQVADRALPGTILDQAPVAGGPLSPGGRLALSVSNGQPAQTPPAASSSSTSSVSSASSSSAPPVASSSSSSSSRAPASASSDSSSLSESVASSSSEASGEAMSEAAPVVVEAPPPPPVGFPWWGWLAAAVAVLSALGAGYWLRKPAAPVAAPDVGCELEMGEGRITSDGPLVDGPAVEVRVESELGAAEAPEITVLDNGEGS